MVDHTALAPEVNAARVEELCYEAVEHGFAAICVNGLWVGRAQHVMRNIRLANKDNEGFRLPKVCSVVGFPLGCTSPVAMAEEAAGCVCDGAQEIDMVLPVGPVLDHDTNMISLMVSKVREATPGATLKVIIEAAALTANEIKTACAISVAEGAEFVKTSTGFHPAGGASVHDVIAMRNAVGPDFGVKASGGIRTREDAIAMIDAGANRLGMSAAVEVMNSFNTHS